MASVLLRPIIVNLVLLPVIGALHGYVTNWLAVWLLFHPRQPVRIPLVRFAFQGVLPRRQPDLARSVGLAVERELLSWDRLAATFLSPAVRAELAVSLDRVVTQRLEERLPRFLPPAIRRLASDLFRDFALKEVDPLLEGLADALRQGALHGPSLAGLVEERLLALDVRELETLVRRAAGRELHSIVRLGLGMGLLIGLAQGVFLEVIGQ